MTRSRVETYRGVTFHVGPGRLHPDATRVELALAPDGGAALRYVQEHSRGAVAVASILEIIDRELGHKATDVPCPACGMPADAHCDLVSGAHAARLARARARFDYGAEAAAILARAAS